MGDAATRLVWALPLVLGLGLAAMVLGRYALRRLGVSTAPAQPMVLRQSLSLSDALRAHLLSIEGERILLVECGGVASVHGLSNSVPAVRILRKRSMP